ncbi:MAG: hypothetical protein OXG87_01315 [Gemmatimonadetes bacterium]|nr:hypothetical protein [Gemmatimonadota bacterium]
MRRVIPMLGIDSGSKKVQRTTSRSRFIPQFRREVCEVINRVRAAYGPVPMKTVADYPEVKAAEATIEQAARLVCSGLENVKVWRGALVVYELTWMSALKKVRPSDKSAA